MAGIRGKIYVLLGGYGRALGVGVEVPKGRQVERAHVLNGVILLFGSEVEMNPALLGIMKGVYLFYDLFFALNTSSDKAAGLQWITYSGMVYDDVNKIFRYMD